MDSRQIVSSNRSPSSENQETNDYHFDPKFVANSEVLQPNFVEESSILIQD